MKYGVPKSQWDEMAKRNDYDQMNLWGTTRARLMEAELMGRKPMIGLLNSASAESHQQQLDITLV